MTIAGTIILLEASGNNSFLLPLMLTFAAARYMGNAVNDPIYDMAIQLAQLPFLEGSLKTLGLLNYYPTVEVMAHPVVTLREVNRVRDVYNMLLTKTHNGFPVVSRDGHLRGLILRKTLCSILKLKAFSVPINNPQQRQQQQRQQPVSAGDVVVDVDGEEEEIQLAPAATVFHDTLERNYPHYPRIDEISLTGKEMVRLPQ